VVESPIGALETVMFFFGDELILAEDGKPDQAECSEESEEKERNAETISEWKDRRACC